MVIALRTFLDQISGTKVDLDPKCSTMETRTITKTEDEVGSLGTPSAIDQIKED